MSTLGIKGRPSISLITFPLKTEEHYSRTVDKLQVSFKDNPINYT